MRRGLARIALYNESTWQYGYHPGCAIDYYTPSSFEDWLILFPPAVLIYSADLPHARALFSSILAKPSLGNVIPIRFPAEDLKHGAWIGALEVEELKSECVVRAVHSSHWSRLAYTDDRVGRNHF